VGKALSARAQNLHQRVASEPEQQVKRLACWRGGTVNDDPELAFPGAARERGALLVNAVRRKVDMRNHGAPQRLVANR
jgi:hypothetical protein